MEHSWDPEAYLAFADERGRPFDELVARIGAEAPSKVVDLGCGPGKLTVRLSQRWPAATVLGVDTSAAMIEAARDGEPAPGVSFQLGDLRSWRAEDDVDVIVTNAALQWVPDHLPVLDQLVDQLAPGGWLALQVPGNFAEPSHRLLHLLAGEPPFAEHTRGVARPAAYDPQVYLESLSRLGCRVDAWEATYLQVLDGADPVLRWVSGTGARPVLQALPAPLRAKFETEYGRLLRDAYPRQAYGTVLPFRRVFAVAQRQR